MVKTNVERLEGELNEVFNEFLGAKELEIFVEYQEGKDFNYTVSEQNNKKDYSYSQEYSTPLEKKRYLKRFAKLSLYDYLSEKTGEQLPWGALTGIRPTKLYYQQGENRDYFLKEQMRVCDKKYEILQKIANSQSKWYEVNEQNTAFYVGIPFSRPSNATPA